MIKIKFESPIVDKCHCCGQDDVRLSRFVYKNGDAFAAYLAKFTKEHTDKVVYGLMGIGGWGDGTGPKDRIAFPFIIWTNQKKYQIGITNKVESPWGDVDFLGQVLDRKDSLTHPLLKDVFHITDHIITDDKLIIDYLR